MKIGVLACLYGNFDLLPRVMEPWIALKNEGFDIVISAVHAQFKEYAELGFGSEDKETLAALEANRSLFLNLHLSNVPLGEKEARNIALVPLMRAEVDLVWLLDGDELYTKEQIKNIIAFVEKTPRFDYYHVPLDNHIFGNIRWKDGMAPPRIFRTNRHGGIGGFVWDNEVLFGDGILATQLLPGIIPERLARVEHRTWQREGLEKKIAYHYKHFGYSPFKIGKNGKPEYDPAYFALHEMPAAPLIENSEVVMPKRELEVIFRSHASGNFRQGMKRVTDDLGGKEELTVRSLRSLVHSLLILSRANIARIQLTIMDDHSNEEAKRRMQAELEVCPFETEFVPLEGVGNAASVAFAFNRARERANDLIYFVEDDYLHEPHALLEMVEAHSFFGRQTGTPKKVALFPVDELDRYDEAIEPSRVVITGKRHWRTITKTTGTFMLTAALLREQWEKFIRFAEGEVNEQISLNLVWRENAIVFSPIPTLAYHMHTAERMPPFSNWRALWESLDLP